MSVETSQAARGRSGQVMQLKLSLRGVVKPPVWRRLLVPADIRLDRLHEVIQTAIGWTDNHLHVFSTRSGDFGTPDAELGEGFDPAACDLAEINEVLGLTVAARR